MSNENGVPAGGYPSYGDRRQPWHPDFIKYMHFIVSHANYAGLPCTTDAEGKIDWTIPSNRPRGSKNWDGNMRRREWWKEKAHSLAIPLQGKWISLTARTIHPTGQKPCQPCGRMMSIFYVYATKRTIEILNRALPDTDKLNFTDFLTIDEIIDHFYVTLEGRAAQALTSTFPGLPTDATRDEAKTYVKRIYVDAQSHKLSPGAMSNPPDRLDGFHTYNLCCRSKRDKGRSRENLRSYGDDRRAFEFWCEGDWVAANLLMTCTTTAKCALCPHIELLTADHVGPISLGFAHSPNFRPVCRHCNSGKNNRMFHQDVLALLDREKSGERVASWHAQPLWDRCKNSVGNNDDALLLSKLMRINQHHYLIHLSEVWEAGAPDALLQFLNPEQALCKVQFVELDCSTLKYEGIIRVKRNDTYAHSKACRMVRIAFESLSDYMNKQKRNIQGIVPSLAVDQLREYGQAVVKAQREASSLRPRLSGALQIADPEDRAAALVKVFGGKYKPDHDFSYLRHALGAVISRYAGILALRYERKDAVAWDD